MSRRGNGEGTIYQRRDGRWEAAVTLGGGKRKRLYAKTRLEAARRLTAVLRDHTLGLPIGNDRLAVAAYLQQWLAAVKPTIRARTFTSYEGVVRSYLVPELGRVTLVRLTPQQVQEMISKMLAEGKSARVVAYARVVLRIALGRAEKWGLVQRNVAALVDPPKVGPRPIQPFTADEAKAFLRATETDRLYCLWVLALTTGLRQGELLGLTWQDIDLDLGQLVVRFQLQRIAGQLCRTEPKTMGSRRRVVLAPIATAALRDHRRRQMDEGFAPLSDGFVFMTSVGTALDPRNMLREYKATLKRAGLADRRFHDARHSFASMLLADGVSLKAVADLLGHSSIRMAGDVYGHLLPVTQQDAARRMAKLLG